MLSPDGFIVLRTPATARRWRPVLRNRAPPVHTGVTYELLGLSFRAVAADNEGKNFHPEANRWLG